MESCVSEVVCAVSDVNTWSFEICRRSRFCTTRFNSCKWELYDVGKYWLFTERRSFVSLLGLGAAVRGIPRIIASSLAADEVPHIFRSSWTQENIPRKHYVVSWCNWIISLSRVPDFFSLGSKQNKLQNDYHSAYLSSNIGTGTRGSCTVVCALAAEYSVVFILSRQSAKSTNNYLEMEDRIQGCWTDQYCLDPD